MEKELLDLSPQDRLLELYKQDRIIQGKWVGIDREGRETACLYAALVPGARSTDSCPARLMPQWLAEMIPSISDKGSHTAWPSMFERFARAVPAMGKLTPEAERRVLAKTMLKTLAIARPHNPKACDPIISLWKREFAGFPPTLQEWHAARAKAADGLLLATAGRPRLGAQWAPAEAAAVAVWAAADANAPVVAARWAAKAEWEAESLTWDGMEAQAKAWDKITDALLTAVEAEG